MSTKTAVQPGSQIVSALEKAWKAIQRNCPDLPDVVMITGTGSATGAWGYTWHERWNEGRPPGLPGETDTKTEGEGDHEGGQTVINPQTKKTELFIAGERLACGGKLTFQTLVHEAAHVLAHKRGEQDTSRQGRYHNKTFVKIVTELGLEWPANEKPHPTIGFSGVVITEATEKKYAKVITMLDDAIGVYLDIPGYWVGTTSTTTTGVDGTSGTTVITLPRKGGRRSRTGQPARNHPVYVCDCEKPRGFRMPRSTFDQAPISCGACGADFHLRDQEDED
jgi:hypothetical protein